MEPNHVFVGMAVTGLCLVLLIPFLRSTSRSSGAANPTEARAPASKYGKGNCVKHPSGERLSWEDGYLGKYAIWFIASRCAVILGIEVPKKFVSFDELAEMTKGLLARGDPATQSETVFKALNAVVPSFVAYIFRVCFPGNKQWACEANARMSPLITKWLVGKSATIEGEVQPIGEDVQVWKSSVKIERCRYVEASACKTACVNLCKVPTQRFFTETMGIPLTMHPDFSDCSCTMVFGQHPPPLEEDPVAEQLCYDICANVPDNIEDIRLRAKRPTSGASAMASGSGAMGGGGGGGGVRRRGSSVALRTCHTSAPPVRRPRGGPADITLTYAS